MKLKEIIEKLCNHEISKAEAIEKITSIMDGLRRVDSLEFEVVECGFVVPGYDGYLKLRLPYGYDKMKDKVSSKDKVDVTFLP